MTALYLVGDVFDRVAELRRRRVQVALVLCSPPFLALRSYLPDGHPLKGSEIGSEATPAAFIDVMLALVAGLAHVLAPWGSIAFELGDTYSGTGGAGGDWSDSTATTKARVTGGSVAGPTKRVTSSGWPLDKSLAGIPEAFMLSLAYGYNVLDRRGPDSPAGRWRVRNFKPWIRSNPPVGALGDKERPATSYVTVATRDAARYFDLDAVRTAPAYGRSPDTPNSSGAYTGHPAATGIRSRPDVVSNAAVAPPRDWWHHVDAVLDACLDDMAGKTGGGARGKVGRGRLSGGPGGDQDKAGDWIDSDRTSGARGVHLRRRLEVAGILRTLDAIDQSPKGYKGAHYAVWPPELVRLLVDEMCPRRVCSTCGQPSRRIVETERTTDGNYGRPHAVAKSETNGRTFASNAETSRATVGWSDCGHDAYQPGVVLDPFVGSGTTLQVVSGMGLRGIGIDLDYTNVALAIERVGMWLAVEWPAPDLDALEHRALGPGSPHPASYDRWAHLAGAGRRRQVNGGADEPAAPTLRPREGGPPPIPATYKRPAARAVPSMAGQLDLLALPTT